MFIENIFLVYKKEILYQEKSDQNLIEDIKLTDRFTLYTYQKTHKKD